ncbi:MAG: right-handed parallel beta-helix repeat-containing protein [Verrucomicrobia bacterium]|nr:right-handed parallel beta-helix repeat-containing protein [Verrucomicrobiota bacterium]
MNKLIPLIGLAVLCLAAVAPASSQSAPNNSARKITEQKADLIELINRGISSGMGQITIPPGRYRVSTKSGVYLRLNDLRDITIIADGVEMICTQTVPAIDIMNCENLTLQGLSIDYDPLPYTQARIAAVTEDNNEIDVVAIPGYPALPSGPTAIEVYDPATNQLRTRNTNLHFNSTLESPNKATLQRESTVRSVPFAQAGDVVVITARNNQLPAPHAVSTSSSDRITFRNVTLYAGYQAGFIESKSTEIKYLGCRIDRRPPGEDIVSRGYPRLRSVNQRGIFSTNARSGPLLERCTIAYTGYDSVMLTLDSYYVVATNGATLRVIAFRTDLLDKGDNVQFMSQDGTRAENRKILEVGPVSEPSDTERALFAAEKHLVPQIANAAGIKAYTLKLDAAANVSVGTLVSHAATVDKGFVIKESNIGLTQRFGIVVNVAGGQILGNRITGTMLSGISVRPYYEWLAGGLADGLKITGNTISNGRSMGISIVAVDVNGNLPPAGTFRNLTIRDNTISGGADPGIVVTSVQGLVNTNNKVQNKPDLTQNLNNWDKTGWVEKPVQPVMLLNTK